MASLRPTGFNSYTCSLAHAGSFPLPLVKRRRCCSHRRSRRVRVGRRCLEFVDRTTGEHWNRGVVAPWSWGGTLDSTSCCFSPER